MVAELKLGLEKQNVSGLNAWVNGGTLNWHVNKEERESEREMWVQFGTGTGRVEVLVLYFNLDASRKSDTKT